MGTVGRPGGGYIAGGVVGQANETGAVGIHEVNIRVDIGGAARHEDDFGAVGRPGRIVVFNFVNGELGQVGAVAIDDEDFAPAAAGSVGDVQDFGAVRRPGWIKFATSLGS